MKAECKISKQNQGLLEILSQKTGCMYISDLHRPELRPRIGYAARELTADEYSLKEWLDAICYITGESCSFQTSEEACVYLQNLGK